MMGYICANYGNLWSVFNVMAASLTAKEAEYIINKETTRKLNAQPINSLQYLKAALEDPVGTVFHILYC